MKRDLFTMETSAPRDAVVAVYQIPARGDAAALRTRADAIALGMTVGSWTGLPLAQQERLRRHAAEVVDVELVQEDATPGNATGGVCALLRIAYPIANFTPDVPALLTATFGKLSMDGAIRLVDLELPPSFAAQFPGPKLGVEGVRRRLGPKAAQGPLLMSIFKSCLGLNLDEFVEAFAQQARGGVDLVKDDEIFFNDASAPFLERIAACRRAAQRVADQTGRRTAYAVNLTGPVHQLRDRARAAAEAGADCLLLNVLAYGYDALQQLAADPNVPLPVMAHPALAGAFYPSREHGIAAPLLLGKLMRWAGADLVLFPSPYGSVALPPDEARQIAAHLAAPGPHRPAFAVPSAGIHPGTVPAILRDFGQDVVINAGGGVHGHPQGAEAGGRAFRAAIEAAVTGQPLRAAAAERAAAGQPELQAALDKWGVVEP